MRPGQGASLKWAVLLAPPLSPPPGQKSDLHRVEHQPYSASLQNKPIEGAFQGEALQSMAALKDPAPRPAVLAKAAQDPAQAKDPAAAQLFGPLVEPGLARNPQQQSGAAKASLEVPAPGLGVHVSDPSA